MKHTRQCMAQAIICAVENFRDASEGWSDADFVNGCQNDLWSTAEGYLADGIKTCMCPGTVEIFGQMFTRQMARKLGAIDPTTGQVYEV